jgi:hypothetical protein
MLHAGKRTKQWSKHTECGCGWGLQMTDISSALPAAVAATYNEHHTAKLLWHVA